MNFSKDLLTTRVCMLLFCPAFWWWNVHPPGWTIK